MISVNQTNVTSGVIGCLCGLYTWLFHAWDGSMKVLITLVIVDYITGVLKSAYKGKLESSVGFWGIARKLFIFALIAVAHIIDAEFLGHKAMLREVVIYFYCANEGFSIIENADALNVPIPKIIKNMFAKLKSKDDESCGLSKGNKKDGE